MDIFEVEARGMFSPPNGNHPQAIPDLWRSAPGEEVRTDLPSLSDEELNALGWKGPIQMPPTPGTSYFTHSYVKIKRKQYNLQDNLEFIKGDFNQVATTWDREINILHIDGSHHYDDVKKDFQIWSKFVKDDGVILLHDTCVENFNGNEYGVKKFFSEVDLPKINFTYTFGLGVISKNEELIEYIKVNFDLSRPL